MAPLIPNANASTLGGVLGIVALFLILYFGIRALLRKQGIKREAGLHGFAG
jgi:hypothetical protein